MHLASQISYILNMIFLVLLRSGMRKICDLKYIVSREVRENLNINIFVHEYYQHE